ncbi:O-antigen ligase family protein [Hydrogenophaga aquatica]
MKLNSLCISPLDAWLTALVAMLFFAFPTALGVANLATLMLIATGVLMLRHAETRLKLTCNRMVWMLAGLYTVVLVGVLYTPADWSWVGLHLGKYAKLLYAALIIALLSGEETRQKVALNAFVAAMLVTLASTWLNVWFLLPWSASQETGWGKSHHVFGDYITQNVMMSFFCALTLHRTLNDPDGARRVGWAVITLAAALSITHLSNGRTGYLLVLTSLLTYALVASRGRRLVVSIAGMVVAGVLAVSASDILQSRLVEALEEARARDVNNESSIGHRLYNYKTTPKLIAEAPLFGHGTGAYHEEICRFVERAEQCQVFAWHPHNQFLFLAADHGLLGAALYLALIISMFVMAMRSKDKTAGALLAVLAAVMLVDSMINSPLWSARESHFFMYMLALLVAMCQTPEKKAMA